MSLTTRRLGIAALSLTHGCVQRTSDGQGDEGSDMLIINGGMPRSGTVLVGNLIRLMLERRGIGWRRFNPQERRHLPSLLKLAQTPIAKGAIIVHTHLINAEIIGHLERRNDTVMLWNHRDPRDALVSLMQLHDLSLEDGIKALRVYGHATEIAHTAPSVLKITYERLIEDLAGHILEFASQMQFELQPGEIDDLARSTSPKAHSGVMQQLNDNTLAQTRTVPTKRRVMREDPKTLINDRHIQSGRIGRWHTELPSDEHHDVNGKLAHWIRLLGYDEADFGVS